MRNKKIIFFINSINLGGAEKQISLLMNELANDRNNSIYLITLDSSKSDFYRLDQKKIKRYSCNQKKKDNFFEKLFNIIGLILKIRSLIISIRPNTIVGFLPLPSIIMTISSLGIRCKKIISIRNNPNYINISFLWKILYKFSFNFYDTIVVQTSELKFFYEKKYSNKQIINIPNIYKNNLLLKKKKIINPPKKKFILAVGKINSQKGFDLLLEAYNKIQKKIPKIKLFILSNSKNIDQKYYSYLKNFIKKNNLINKVKFHFDVSNISDWYRNSSVYVLSSRYEGYPNSICEAKQNNTFILSFNCKYGPKEILRNYSRKKLIQRENIYKLSEELEQFFKKKIKYRKTKFCSSSDIKVIKKWNEIL